MTEHADLAALIGSRICHDLISPIGAIGNGVELMLLDGASQTPELALVSESVAQASARIRFFRLAFGAATGDQRIGQAEVTGLLADLTRGSRQTIDWSSAADLSRREVKVVLLAILCLETALPLGGRIRVEQGETRWTVTGEGQRLRVEPTLWDSLSKPVHGAEVLPAQVQFLILPEAIARQHRRLTVDIRPDLVRLSF